MISCSTTRESDQTILYDYARVDFQGLPLLKIITALEYPVFFPQIDRRESL